VDIHPWTKYEIARLRDDPFRVVEAVSSGKE
jgi:hypothetical protein